MYVQCIHPLDELLTWFYFAVALFQNAKLRHVYWKKYSMIFAVATTGRCFWLSPVLPSTASAKSNCISFSKCMGRMLTWGTFIGRNTVWFLQLPLLAGACDCRQCCQAQQVQNPTVLLSINVWAECRVGARLLEEIWYVSFWQPLHLQAGASQVLRFQAPSSAEILPKNIPKSVPETTRDRALIWAFTVHMKQQDI